MGAAVRANGLGRRGGGGDDGCCCRHWRRGGRTPDGNVRARYVFATERMVPLVIRFPTIIYGASAVYDRTRKHGPTLKDADDDRLFSLSLSNRVCCGHVANGRKRERTSKTKWRERHSATNWSDCRRRIWRQTGVALKKQKCIDGNTLQRACADGPWRKRGETDSIGDRSHVGKDGSSTGRVRMWTVQWNGLWRCAHVPIERNQMADDGTKIPW